MNIFSAITGKTEQTRQQTANEFVNVKDVRGNILYGLDGSIFAFLRIQPISLDLLSQREQSRKIREFSAAFSAEKQPFKLFSFSRPVDVSVMSARLERLHSEAEDNALRELLSAELRYVGATALTGNVIERQFYLEIWGKETSDGERELLRRAAELEQRFSSCGLIAELCSEDAIVRLLNQFFNPNYAHLEDAEFAPAIPLLNNRRYEFENDN